MRGPGLILKQAVNKYLEKRRTVKFQPKTNSDIPENQINTNESVETLDSDKSISDSELSSSEEDIEYDDFADENNEPTEMQSSDNESSDD